MEKTTGVPPLDEWPRQAIAWCATCHRFIMYGSAYKMLGLGKFAHAGPCLVIQGGKEE